MPSIVYYAPFSQGGLADYALHQACAMADIGAPVLFLAPIDLLKRTPTHPSIVPIELPHLKRLPGSSYAIRGLNILRSSTANIKELCRCIQRHSAQHVVMASYAEYLSPFWSGRLRRLRQKGVRFGTVVHDPVRDFVVGPLAWHRWSISNAYSFVDMAFVHETIDLDTGFPRRAIPTCVIPHGIYAFPKPDGSLSKESARTELGLPAEAPVFLAFGHIRDGKNLDLVIRSLCAIPSAHLVVAGKEQSASQKPIVYYQQIADSLGVAGRCHWRHNYIPSDQVWKYFAACDHVVLCYSNAFRSASGVLNAAAAFERSVVASSGEGPLRSAVRDYQLGAWCPPDDVQHLENAFKSILANPPAPQWKKYREDHSWERNARICLQSMYSLNTLP